MSINVDNTAPLPPSIRGSTSLISIEVNPKPSKDSNSNAKPRVQFSNKIQRFPESAPTSPRATSPNVLQSSDIEPKSETPTTPSPTNTTAPATSVPQKSDNDETPSLSGDIQVGAAPPSFDTAIEVLHDKSLTRSGSNVVIEVNSPLPETVTNAIPCLISPVTSQTTSSELAQSNNLSSKPERSGLITHAILNIEIVREPKENPKNQDEWDADFGKIFFAFNLFEHKTEAGAMNDKIDIAQKTTKVENAEAELFATTQVSGVEQSLNSVTLLNSENSAPAFNEILVTAKQTIDENVTQAEAEKTASYAISETVTPHAVSDTDQPTINEANVVTDEQNQKGSVIAAEVFKTFASGEANEVTTLGSVEQISSTAQRSSSGIANTDEFAQKDATDSVTDLPVNATPESATLVTGVKTDETGQTPDISLSIGTSIAIPVNINQASAAITTVETSTKTTPTSNVESVSTPIDVDLVTGSQPVLESENSLEKPKKADLSPLLTTTPSNDPATLNSFTNACTSSQTTIETTYADVADNIDVNEQKNASLSNTSTTNSSISAAPAAFDTLPATTTNVDVRMERAQSKGLAIDNNQTKEIVTDGQQQTMPPIDEPVDWLTKPADSASAEETCLNKKPQGVIAPTRFDSNQLAPTASQIETSNVTSSTDITNGEQKTIGSFNVIEQTVEAVSNASKPTANGEKEIEIPISFEKEREVKPSDIMIPVQLSTDKLLNTENASSAGKEELKMPVVIEKESQPKSENIIDASTAKQAQVEASMAHSAVSVNDVKHNPNYETVEIPVKIESIETTTSNVENKLLKQNTNALIITDSQAVFTTDVNPDNTFASKSLANEEMIGTPVQFENQEQIVINIPIMGDKKVVSPEDTIQIPIQFEGNIEKMINVLVTDDAASESKPSTDVENAEDIINVPIEIKLAGPEPVLKQVVDGFFTMEEDELKNAVVNIPIEVESKSISKTTDAIQEQMVDIPILSGDEEKIVNVPIEIDGEDIKPVIKTLTDQQQSPFWTINDTAVTSQDDKILNISNEIDEKPKSATQVIGANVENVAVDTVEKPASPCNTTETPIPIQIVMHTELVEENVIQTPSVMLNGEMHLKSVVPTVPEVKTQKILTDSTVADENSQKPQQQQQSIVTESSIESQITSPPAIVASSFEQPNKAVNCEIASLQPEIKKIFTQEPSVPKEVTDLATQIADSATADAVKTVDGTSAFKTNDKITIQTTFSKPLFEDNSQPKQEVSPIELEKDDEFKFQTTFAKPMDLNPSLPILTTEKSPKTESDVSSVVDFVKPLSETSTSEKPEKPKEVAIEDSSVSWIEVPASKIKKEEEQSKSPTKDTTELQVQTGFAKPLLSQPEESKIVKKKSDENTVNQTEFAKPLLQESPTNLSKKSISSLHLDENNFWTEVPSNAVVRDIPIKIVSTTASEPTLENVNEAVLSQYDKPSPLSSPIESKPIETPKSPASVQPKADNPTDEIIFYEVSKGHDTLMKQPAQSLAASSSNKNDDVDLNITQYEEQLKKNTKEALALVDRLVDKTTALGQQQIRGYRPRSDQYSLPHDRRSRSSSNSPQSRRSVTNSPFNENTFVETHSYRVNPKLLGDATAVALLPDFRLVLADLEKGLTVFNLYTKEQKRFECNARFRNPLCLYNLPRPKEILVLCEYSENSDGNFSLYICRFTYNLEYVNRVEAPKFLHGKVITTYCMTFCHRTGCLYLAASSYNTGYLYELSSEGFWTEVYTGRNKHFTDIAIFAVIDVVTEIMLIDSIKDYVVVVSVYNSEKADHRVVAASEKPTSLCIDECGHVIIFDRSSNKVGIHSRLTNLRYHDIALVEHSKCRLAAFAGLLAVLSPTKKELRIYKY